MSRRRLLELIQSLNGYEAFAFARCLEEVIKLAMIWIRIAQSPVTIRLRGVSKGSKKNLIHSTMPHQERVMRRPEP
jgi:hypothetical protein